MSDQCKQLENLGFHATFIGKDVSENDSIENGMCDFVFWSPQILVADTKWREIIKSHAYQIKLKLLIVDEAHTIIQWKDYINVFVLKEFC